MSISHQQILDSLACITHPEHNKSIVELGIVQNIQLQDSTLTFSLRLLAGNDPFGPSLQKAAKKALNAEFPELSVEIAIEHPSAPTAELPPRKGGVANVKNTIAIASGKGGVGKSTITTNLAVSLARKGYSVGILDADVFGPSMPIMLGVTGQYPEVLNEEGEDLIVPLEAHGVKMLSMGFFVATSQALVWRGPMASNALKQVLHMGLWGELDFLLVDLPPGTSDIHLTVIQELALTGAIVVSTPQQVALADAHKAFSLFRGVNVNVPIIGIVENMAWFEPLELPGHRYYIFGKEGTKELATEYDVPLLAQIPLVQGIREGGDSGCPTAAETSPLTDAFDLLADRFLEEWGKLPQQTTK